jgi:hypothetical protein
MALQMKKFSDQEKNLLQTKTQLIANLRDQEELQNEMSIQQAAHFDEYFISRKYVFCG